MVARFEKAETLKQEVAKKKELERAYRKAHRTGGDVPDEVGPPSYCPSCHRMPFNRPMSAYRLAWNVHTELRTTRQRSARESGHQVECPYRVADKASALGAGSDIPKSAYFNFHRPTLVSLRPVSNGVLLVCSSDGVDW